MAAKKKEYTAQLLEDLGRTQQPEIDYSNPTAGYDNPADHSIGSQLGAAEQAAGNSPTDSSNVSDAERQDAPSNPWDYSGDKKGSKEGGGRGDKAKTFMKKHAKKILFGSAGGFGIAGALLMFSGPATLLPWLTGAMSGGIMNVQWWPMKNNSGHVWRQSLSGQVCTAVSATCKFKKMPARMVKRLDKAGFKLFDSGGHPISPGSGRQSVHSIQLPDNVKPLNGVMVYDATTIQKAMATDPAVSKAFRKAGYDPKFAGFTDRTFSRVVAKAKASKRPPLPETGDAEEMKSKLRSAVNDGVAPGQSSFRVAPVDPDNQNGTQQIVDQNDRPVLGDDGKPITKSWDDRASLTAQVEEMNRSTSAIASGAEEAASSGKRAVTAAVSGMSESNLQKIAGFVNVTGGTLNYVCGLYNAVRAVGVGIKMVRNIQLIRYAMAFMSAADAMRLGKATPAQGEFLGNTLTTVLRAASDEVIKDTDGTILADIKKGDIVQGAATDGVGMKYVLFGDRMPPSESMMNFMGSLGGSIWGAMLAGINQGASKIGEHNLASDCKKVRSIAFQIADAAIGITINVVVGIFTAGTGNAVLKSGQIAFQQAVKAAIKQQFRQMFNKGLLKNKRFWTNIVGNLGFEAIVAILPGVLTDIAAGVVIDDDTLGEQAGDAWAVGASSMFKEACQAGGCAPLSPQQAVNQANQTRGLALAYAAEERIGANWYDVRNPYTPLGSFAGNMSVHMDGATNSIPAFFAKTYGLIGTAFRGALAGPRASAEEISSDYFKCADLDYEAAGVGCDYLGIPTYGLTTTTDLGQTVAYMEDNNLIDAEGDPVAGTVFSEFIEKCVDRGVPIGTESLEGQADVGDGVRCMQDTDFASGSAGPTIAMAHETLDSRGQLVASTDQVAAINGVSENVVFYNYLIYKRILDSMDEEPNDDGSAGSSLTIATPDNVTQHGRGWTLTPGMDYSSIPCATGTTEFIESYNNREFSIPSLGLSGGVTFKICTVNNTTITVNSLISGNVAQMIDDAWTTAGIRLNGTGWRSNETQTNLYKSRGCPGCSPPVATPGTSQHEGGGAIDFNFGSNKNSDGFKWLAANAARYGLINLDTPPRLAEPWHWSTTGW
ncbi:M15 family metallopeptidase [Candidatus Saccharibacteria bacterium]|nr:M15 family metallopeptidase [Candidatus Saccharibacteria bacterium]